MSARTNNVIRLAVSNPVLTIKETAGGDFAAVPEFVDLQANRRRTQAQEEKLQRLCAATHLAVIVLGRSKSELVELVRSIENERVGGAELHHGLMRGRELAAAILDMMTAAETRVAAALAV
jgi:hypothetical protein